MKKTISIIISTLFFGAVACGVVFGIKWREANDTINTMYTQEQVEQIKEDFKNEWADQEKEYVSQIEECLTAFEQLQITVDESKNALTGLQSQYNVLLNKYNQSEGANKDLISQIEKNETDLEELNAELISITNSLTGLQSQYNVLLNKYNQSESENDNLLDEISDLESQISSLNTTISNLNTQILEYESLIEAYEKYEGIVFQVKFYSDDQIFNTEVVNNGSYLNLDSVAEPYKKGYEFQGWSETPGGSVISEDNILITSNKSYYAVFACFLTNSQLCDLALEDIDNVGFLDLTPYPITEIPEEQFKGNLNIVSVACPASLTDISSSAFENCSNLRIFDFNDIKDISNYAFRGCSSLADGELILSETVENIGMYAFEDCDLTSVAIKGSPLIVEHAFKDNTNLEKAYITKGTTFSFLNTNGIFSNCPDVTIYTDAESYQSTWQENFNNTGSGSGNVKLAPIVYNVEFSDFDNIVNFAGSYSVGLKNEYNKFVTVAFNVSNGTNGYNVTDVVLYKNTNEFRSEPVVTFNGDTFSIQIDDPTGSGMYFLTSSFEYNHEANEFELISGFMLNSSMTEGYVRNNSKFDSSQTRIGQYAFKFNFSYGSATYTENYVFNVTLSDELNDDGSVLYNFEYVSSTIFDERHLGYNPIFTYLSLVGYIDEGETVQIVIELNYENGEWVVSKSQALISGVPVPGVNMTVELQKV